MELVLKNLVMNGNNVTIISQPISVGMVNVLVILNTAKIQYQGVHFTYLSDAIILDNVFETTLNAKILTKLSY